jgi:hypothetical protein
MQILSIVVKQDTYLLAKPANETPPTQRHLHEGLTFGNSQAACKYILIKIVLYAWLNHFRLFFVIIYRVSQKKRKPLK